MITISETIENVDVNQVQCVYQSVGWNRHTPDVIQTIFAASNVICLAFHQEKVVGIGRAISDGVFNAAIYDVVVHHDFQGQRIGQAIMKNLLGRLEDVSCVHLISTTRNEAFYSQFGLKRTKTGMARYQNPNLANEYLIP
ncbi:GNAT family N-acetyltransferase [Priestia koreensis]|uniref:GCN5 family acetyltransferase n=1 Tax=Priestia koreensis TaxID=284581 RepID=A0A0M0KYQ5_9BACI|nr:GNAT family N-acetyltransferase [Priestia koreensis]KOO43528.1 GCN5 family acetyltransferase [Priestia koreensis]